MESFDCSLDQVIRFLGGDTSYLLQSLLLYNGKKVLSESECEEVRTQCTNGVLSQLPWLQQPYSQCVFFNRTSRERWLSEQPLSRRAVTLTPFSYEPVVIRAGGISTTIHH